MTDFKSCAVLIECFQGTWQFISTALLRCPGKTHEISDDLESSFFVLLYYALHYVRHNKSDSDVDMEMLFDEDEERVVDGKTIIYGGKGKARMYTHKSWVTGLEFSSKPLTDLFWELRGLFRGLEQYEVAEEDEERAAYLNRALKAKDPKEILRLFKKALDRDDWPDNDKVSDQFPRRSTSVVAEPSPGHWTNAIKSNISTSSKRKAESADEGLDGIDSIHSPKKSKLSTQH